MYVIGNVDNQEIMTFPGGDSSYGQGMETLMKPEMCTGNDDWMITNVKLKILDADLLAQF